MSAQYPLPPPPDIVGRMIQALSLWIDTAPANMKRDPEALTLIRLAKITEEAGEVIDAHNGVNGSNPRKGEYGSIEAVKTELLDVALTALAAWEHLDGNRGDVMWDFAIFVAGRHHRVLGATTAPLT
jgi:NTP pyrophosphatase (non-canonical NTP hydrolase)